MMDGHDPSPSGSPSASSEAEKQPARPGRLNLNPVTFVAAGLTVLALIVSGYLAFQSLRGNAIAGCGGDDGCGAVLASPWAKLGDYPVSLLGAAVYLVILLSLGLRVLAHRFRGLADSVLLCAVPVLIGAAGWFTYIQMLVLGEFCPFCMVGHGLGLSIAVALIVLLAQRRAARVAGPVAVGLLGVGLLAFVQTYAPAADKGQTSDNLNADHDYDRINDAGQREIGLFGGAIELTIQDTPHRGDPAADQVLAMVFDYGCPHCRDMRAMLEQMQAEGSDFVLVLLPMSIAADRNEYIQSDQPQFADSHALAMMSLWLYDTNPQAWQGFDRWLLEAPDYRTAEQAAAKVNELLPDQNLSYSQVLDAIAKYRDKVERNIAVLALIPQDRLAIPVLTAPGSPKHLTRRVYSSEPVRDLLSGARTHLETTNTDLRK